MGCIQASSYTSGTILGTYSGVDALDQCNNFCGVCCIPGCESDFANISSCSGTTELIPCGFCEYYIDENTQNYYVDTNYKITCSNGGVGGANTGPWIAQTQYGYCPANYASGCFDGSYDCSSEFIKASGEYIDYFSDPTNIYSFISGGVYTNATTSDPCGGNYPCTKIIEVKTFSTISVQKNPYSPYSNYETCEVNYFDSKVEAGIWDNSYLGGTAGLFTNEFFIGCANGTGTLDYNMYYDFISGYGAYANYIPDCCSGVINPNNNTNKDKVWIFRIKGSVKKIIVYNEGNHLSNQTYNGFAPDYLCNTCNETPTEGPSGIYISEIHYAVSRAHDLRLYLCDPTTTTMTDVSSYICNKNIPFFVPTPWDSIDWVGDEGYNETTIDNFSPTVGTIWGFSPIGTPNGTLPLTSNYYCVDRNPCNIDGFTRNNQNPNNVCPPCDPFNGIVGTTRQSNGTLYIVHTATSVSGSLSPIGVATPPLVQFPDLPYISGNAVNYTCSDTIGQSGCSDQIGSTWYSGQNCTSFNCNI